MTMGAMPASHARGRQRGESSRPSGNSRNMHTTAPGQDGVDAVLDGDLGGGEPQSGGAE
jgi:hypothetical protein